MSVIDQLLLTLDGLSGSERRPVYLHPDTIADVRHQGRDLVDLVTEPALLRSGMVLGLMGFPIYSSSFVPGGYFYAPPDDGLANTMPINKAWLHPKPPRTRWERLLSDNPF